jgi:hypothetical protein
MLRRVISTGVLVVCAAVYVLAATERATFILTSGERKSGAVVFHTPARENLINGQLNLGNDQGGPELSFPVGDVAVIDFAGGQPAPTELAQVPASGQFLALRNGQGQTGTLVNLVNGDTVVWKNDAGQTQQYAIGDVARVYLNPQAARTAFNYTGPAANAVGTSGTAAPVAPGTVQVPANQAWTDSGLTVKKGDRVSFNATGQIAFGQSPGQTAGPDGNGDVRGPQFPVPVMPVGGLIGRVGAGTPFPIGSNTQPIVMPADGRLMLGVNDNELGDNSGAFAVVVRKQ